MTLSIEKRIAYHENRAKERLAGILYMLNGESPSMSDTAMIEIDKEIKKAQETGRKNGAK